ncbi:receptor tyrosine-protein kinase erbB-4-like isoform X1 [Petromyzon marinus]|uniref:receptor protein-tyrosine kinase n=2 Tax=Petromyzon marinus TaxID=7757 RepID=A0AAJ7X5C1_PETMA|nr:receptor tyrosine-protein kinase erbB-4-like isoform X1 [Petromyzon marinus]
MRRDTRRGALLLLLGLALWSAGSGAREVCVGTEHRLELLVSKTQHYESLKILYQGCEVVLGNLEITHLSRGDDLSFLKDVREVMGYVLVALNDFEELPLESLRIVRGMKLYDDKFALAIVDNGQRGLGTGLRALLLRSLTEILSGGVNITDNPFLCHADTIKWEDILEQKNLNQSVLPYGRPDCPPCPQGCSHCWSADTNYCQKLTRTICAKECTLRCYGTNTNQCCHKHCASGCTGPRDTDCLACKTFNDTGVCVMHCPPTHIYNRDTYLQEPNPDVKYSHGAICVKRCPQNFLIDENSCARSCPHEKMEVEENGVKMCKACSEKQGCPKVCHGIGSGNLKDAKSVSSLNVDTFSECTTINGNLVFLESGLDSDLLAHPEKMKVFRSVREITGYLHIEAWLPNMTDLSVFENLEIVRGRNIRSVGYSVLVRNLPHLEVLGLRALSEVTEGSVLAQNVPRLCYVLTVNWTRLLRSPRQKADLEGVPSSSVCGSEACHPLCSSDGCWGPGPEQCMQCKLFKRGRTCVESCNQNDGEVREFINGTLCTPCHSECLPTNGTLSCKGPTSDMCTRCRHFKDGPYCVDKCPLGQNTEHGALIFKFPDAHNACMPCHANCTHGCNGPLPVDCVFPWSESSSSPTSSKTPVVLAAVVGSLCMVVVLTLGVLLYKRSSNQKRKKTLRRYAIERELEPLTPSGMTPNQAQLHILKETELRRGKVLGSGAFGTVYKGIWTPEGETVKIPVAIKVLREDTSPRANKEILDEAYVMASIDHQHLVRLLGICLSSTTQLVTQLMPYGCLLDYVREHTDKIGSQPLLNWCVQIAKGMNYLEDRRLVHRDLAARNVLVKAPNHVKITDFGLAKLLDLNETEYHSEGGKLPIKWLALESIQQRIFTHQSDVWSYGVTLWELMTFGGKPYDGVPARDIPELLEKGERLTQPPICTIDVYMIMVKCWMIDAESRPKFRELAAEFSKMARDPTRYLVIQGDERMKLPSPTDSRFLQSLMEEDDMSQMVDAEEYLTPPPFPLRPPPPPGAIDPSGSNSPTLPGQGITGTSDPDSEFGSEHGAAAPRMPSLVSRSISRQLEDAHAHYPGSGAGGSANATAGGSAADVFVRGAGGYGSGGSGEIPIGGSCVDGKASLPRLHNNSVRHRYSSDPTGPPVPASDGGGGGGDDDDTDDGTGDDLNFQSRPQNLDNPEYMNPINRLQDPLALSNPEYINYQAADDLDAEYVNTAPSVAGHAAPYTVQNPEYLEPRSSDTDADSGLGPLGSSQPFSSQAFDNQEYLEDSLLCRQASLDNPEYICAPSGDRRNGHLKSVDGIGGGGGTVGAVDNPEYLLAVTPLMGTGVRSGHTDTMV